MDCKSRNYVKIWQKLCEGRKGLRQKVLSWTKILSPNISFVTILRFVGIHTFWKSLDKKCFFGSKTCFRFGHQKCPF